MNEPKWRDMFRQGTYACAGLCAAIGALFGLLTLTIGFWRTILIALFCVVGWIVGRSALVGELWDEFQKRYPKRR